MVANILIRRRRRFRNRERMRGKRRGGIEKKMTNEREEYEMKEGQE